MGKTGAFDNLRVLSRPGRLRWESRQEPLTLVLDSDQNLHPVTDRPVTLGGY